MAEMVITAGIDISKQYLDAAVWPTRASIRVANDPAGHEQLAAWLTEQGATRVGLEATGGYEIGVMDALETAAFEVVRFNPHRIRRFAQAKGRLAKNDRADALTIAQATAVLPEIAPEPRRRELDPLVQHLAYRRRVRGWVDDCRNQLEHLTDKALRQMMERQRAKFERELKAIDRKLAAPIEQHEDWRALAESLRTVPGVGPMLAQTLIALLPELGRLSRRAIAGLVGVAPYDHDSGRHSGERDIKGGRAAAREVLYMATVTAMTHNKAIAAFAKRLAGKAQKVIIVARMRKLLMILNAMVRDGAAWRTDNA
jgi:transposase